MGRLSPESRAKNEYTAANRQYYGNTWRPRTGQGDTARLCLEYPTGKLKPVAIVDAGDLCLAPGERAVVPARWDRKVPEAEFWCEESPMSGVSVEPGLCCGGNQEIMLCVVNETEMEVVLERGAPLAEAHEWIKPSSLDTPPAAEWCVSKVASAPAAEMVALTVAQMRELAPQQGDPAAAPELSASEVGRLVGIAESVFGPSGFLNDGQGSELALAAVGLVPASSILAKPSERKNCSRPRGC